MVGSSANAVRAVVEIEVGNANPNRPGGLIHTGYCISLRNPSFAMYEVARRRGPAFFASGWPAVLMPPEAQEAIREAYARWGVAGIFLSRFLPAVRSAVTPFAGIAGMGPWRVMIPAASASALWYAFLVAAGVTVGNNWERARGLVDDANRVLGAIAVLCTLAAAAWLWRRVARRREAP